MSRITQEQYEQMVASHRDAPGNVSAAGRASGVSRATASKYWNDGGNEAWMLPIRKVMEREQVALRSELERQRRESAATRGAELGLLDAEHARADIDQELVETAKLARGAKANAHAMLSVIGALTAGARSIEAELREAFDDGTIAKLVKAKPLEAVRLVRELALLVREGNLAAETAVKLERLMLGDGGVADVHVHVETVEEANVLIRRAEQARLRAQGNRSEAITVETAVLPPSSQH